MKRYLALAAILPALAFGVAACGGDDDESTGGAAATTEQQAPSTQEKGQDVVALAQDTRDLSTLVTAVSTAKLVDTLEGEGPFTVFAPTNAAFQKLGDEQVQSLLEPDNRDQLTKILSYHVVPGKLTAAELSDGQKLETVAGETLTVKVDGGTVMVGDASVVQPDVEASNGVVHVIDGVLTPEA